MGCDIHIYPEKLIDGKWVPVEPFKPSDWWWEQIADKSYSSDDEESYDRLVEQFKKLSSEEAIEKYGDNPLFIWSGPWDDDYYLRGRNYYWFAILADVENGYGDHSFKFIDKPRGLPDDVSSDVLKMAEYWDGDGHSHSWLKLKELLDFNFEQRTKTFKGFVTKEQFVKFLKNGAPDYSTDRLADSAKIVSNNEMKQFYMGIFNGLNLKAYDRVFTNIEWSLTYRDAIGADYLRGILDKLASYGKPEEVRIVFWFDN